MTWKQDCDAIIVAAVEHLPKGLSLTARKAAVDAARPYWVNHTSWGRKAWQAARRDYLIPFGYQPMTKKAKASRAAGMPLFDRVEE